MSCNEKTVVVIGGGIVGLCSSIFLRHKGFKVKLIDPVDLKERCSYGNAGIIATSESMPIGYPDLLKKLPSLIIRGDNSISLKYSYLPFMIRWAYYFFIYSQNQHINKISFALSTLLDVALESHIKLADKASCTNLIHKTGWLKVYNSDSSYKLAQPVLERIKDLGVSFNICTEKEVAELVPTLSPSYRKAVFFDQCRHINTPYDYLNSLFNYFINIGGNYIRAEIRDFKVKENIVSSALGYTGNYSGDYFIISAGAYSKSLVKKLGLNIPLDTERGYHQEFNLVDSEPPKVPILFADDGFVVSPMGKSIRVTSGVEFAGIRGKKDFRQLRNSKNKIQSLLTCKLGDVSSEWVGCRPSMPDSLPVIGNMKNYRNVFLAFGHGHLGLTLGPVTGEIIAGLVSGSNKPIELLPYSPYRF